MYLENSERLTIWNRGSTMSKIFTATCYSNFSSLQWNTDTKFLLFSVCKRGLQFWTNAPKVAAHACACFYLLSPSWFLQSLFGFLSSICKEKKEAAGYPADVSRNAPCVLPAAFAWKVSSVLLHWNVQPFKNNIYTVVSSSLLWVEWLCGMYITSNLAQTWSSASCVWRLSVCSDKCGFILCHKHSISLLLFLCIE
jgi:hypothetical protein